MKVKALSLKQPYANLVASGKKTFETRTWGTDFRGDLLICASASGHEDPRGVALCLVTLVNVRQMKFEDEEAACIELYPRAKVWELTNLRPVRPFPVKGELGLFTVEVPDDIATAI